MTLSNLLGRWTSKTTKKNTNKKGTNSPPERVTLEPTPSAHTYPSPHSRPFQPRSQGEAETLKWLANPSAPAASCTLLDARNRAERHAGEAQRTHATAETRRWVRAPTDGNLARILRIRDGVGSTESTSALKAPGRNGGREAEIPRQVTSPVEVTEEETVGVSSEASQGSNRSASRHADRYVKVSRPRITHPGVGEFLERPRSCVAQFDQDELPPRPSCVPGNYDDTARPVIVELPEVEILTALEGRMTRCQRLLTVSRAGYREWERASSAIKSESSCSETSSSDEEPSGQGEPNSDSGDGDNGDELPLGDWSKDVPQRTSATSDSDSD
ncbi:hypothetical protein IMZ48_48930, partial [Candidatus Bathyarchaeota archaeon]|nr:hypothetical protein [Candidatus Bathyarchaeota archaeon]